jgi:hypothetical protein
LRVVFETIRSSFLPQWERATLPLCPAGETTRLRISLILSIL